MELMILNPPTVIELTTWQDPEMCTSFGFPSKPSQLAGNIGRGMGSTNSNPAAWLQKQGQPLVKMSQAGVKNTVSTCVDLRQRIPSRE